MSEIHEVFFISLNSYKIIEVNFKAENFFFFLKRVGKELTPIFTLYKCKLQQCLFNSPFLRKLTIFSAIISYKNINQSFPVVVIDSFQSFYSEADILIDQYSIWPNSLPKHIQSQNDIIWEFAPKDLSFDEGPIFYFLTLLFPV